jgi:hypothetical protein
LFWDPGKWHWAQTGAFAVSVLSWLYVPPDEVSHRDGCGTITPPTLTSWQSEQAIPDPPPEKSFPWQIWQEANPELPGAFLAVAPCTAGSPHVGDPVAVT